jgi:hypothetical protein
LVVPAAKAVTGMSDELVTFLASFPPIQSAIKVGQDGARVQFDIPETEMPSIVRLMLMRGVVLRVTVEREKTTPARRKARGWKEPRT